MKLIPILALAACCSCTPQQAQSADTIVTDLTNSVCTALEQQNDPAWVTFACTIAQGLESAIPTVVQMTVKVPAASAADFAAKHTGDGGVAAARRVVVAAALSDAGKSDSGT